jgi:hypothetical protein
MWELKFDEQNLRIVVDCLLTGYSQAPEGSVET